MALIFDDLKSYTPNGYLTDIIVSKKDGDDSKMSAITFCWESGKRVKFIFTDDSTVDSAIQKIAQNLSTDIIINKEYLGAIKVATNIVI